MKCPSAEKWDLLALEVLEDDESHGLYSHARVCKNCRQRYQAARREHTERVRMYEAYDRDHDDLREQLMAALPDEQSDHVQGRRPNRSRLGDILMSMNKTTGRRAAALLVPAACILIVAMIFLFPKQNAFAAALEQMRLAETIVCRFQAFIDHAEQPAQDGMLYMDGKRGMRFEMAMGDDITTVIQQPGGPLITIQPATQMVLRAHGAENLRDEPLKSAPDEFIGKFIKLTGKADRLLGRSELDGCNVEGFEISGEKLGLDFAAAGAEENRPDRPRSAARLWVDLSTNLPVRMEIECALPAPAEHILTVYDAFKWNEPLQAGLFEPSIPDDYRTFDVNIPPRSEQTLLEGLKLYAELVGRYPTSLNPASVAAEMAFAMAMNGPSEATSEDPTNAVAAAVNQDFITASVGCTFVRKLEADGHAPEYFGATVSPADTEEVLLRWRLDDGQMRVIYGDLRAETILPTD